MERKSNMVIIIPLPRQTYILRKPKINSQTLLTISKHGGGVYNIMQPSQGTLVGSMSVWLCDECDCVNGQGNMMFPYSKIIMPHTISNMVN